MKVSEIRGWEPGPDLDAIASRYLVHGITTEQAPPNAMYYVSMMSAMADGATLEVSCFETDDLPTVRAQWSHPFGSPYDDPDPVEISVPLDDGVSQDEFDAYFEVRRPLAMWQAIVIAALGLWEASSEDVERYQEPFRA